MDDIIIMAIADMVLGVEVGALMEAQVRVVIVIRRGNLRLCMLRHG